MTEGLSLGWNCYSAVEGVSKNLRNKKQDGYKTCPFDEMITNYNGVIECIKDDFKYLCDSSYLEIIQIPRNSIHLQEGDKVIYNNKYKFIFNHESPGHADLYIYQNWEKGINHYILNDFEELKKRYERRIQNMKELLNSGKFINFLLNRPNTIKNELDKFKNVINEMYPNLKYNIIVFNTEKKVLYDHLLLMKIPENDEEVIRLL